uniref:Uncharacterized protein n=1 Tax=Anguilla anguilla TaxID=7936 RepID=A0A0E9TTT1_ANGAN
MTLPIKFNCKHFYIFYWCDAVYNLPKTLVG